MPYEIVGAIRDTLMSRYALFPAFANACARCRARGGRFDDLRWHTNGCGVWRNVLQYDGICTNFRVIADCDVAENFRPRPDVHVTSDLRGATLTHPQRHLLKDKAIRANDRIGVNYYPVRMQNQQTTPNLCCKWNFRTRHNAPKSMPENCRHTHTGGNRVSSSVPSLVASHACEQRAAGVPRKARFCLARPIGHGGRHHVASFDAVRSRNVSNHPSKPNALAISRQTPETLLRLPLADRR